VIRLHEGKVEQSCPAGMVRVESLEALQTEPSDEVPTTKSRLQPQTTIRDAAAEEEIDANISSRQFYKTERSATGRVATSHYMLVLGSAGGSFYWTLLLISLVGTSLFSASRTYVLREWSSANDETLTRHFLLLYFALLIVRLFVGSFRWIWLYGVGNVGFYNRGSRLIHQRLLDSVCGATFGFFESTPKGRLMNVFGGDVWRLDSHSADDFGRTMIYGMSSPCTT